MIATITIAPTTPPTILMTEFEGFPFGGPGVGDGVPVELESVELEDALAEDVDTAVPLIIAPGRYSGSPI